MSNQLMVALAFAIVLSVEWVVAAPSVSVEMFKGKEGVALVNDNGEPYYVIYSRKRILLPDIQTKRQKRLMLRSNKILAQYLRHINGWRPGEDVFYEMRGFLPLNYWETKGYYHLLAGVLKKHVFFSSVPLGSDDTTTEFGSTSGVSE